jgi:hypothetical protein
MSKSLITSLKSIIFKYELTHTVLGFTFMELFVGVLIVGVLLT